MPGPGGVPASGSRRGHSRTPAGSTTTRAPSAGAGCTRSIMAVVATRERLGRLGVAQSHVDLGAPVRRRISELPSTPYLAESSDVVLQSLAQGAHRCW